MQKVQSNKKDQHLEFRAYLRCISLLKKVTVRWQPYIFVGGDLISQTFLISKLKIIRYKLPRGDTEYFLLLT